MTSDTTAPQPDDCESPVQLANSDAAGSTPRSAWWIAWLILTFALTLWRYPVIDSPPYWDFGQGLWTEANFLAETNFDFQRLWYEERRNWEGGADCYRTSILPTIVAMFMRIAPPPFAQVAYHVLTFACTSGILLLVFAMLRPRGGSVAAVMACLALMSTPLFGVQVDMLGMEIPTTLFAFLSLWWVLHARFALAAISGTLAFFMKATGLLITATTIAYLVGFLLLFWPQSDSQARKRYSLGLLFNLLAIAFQGALVLWGGHIESQLAPSHRAGGPNLLFARYLCPDLVLLGMATVVVVILALLMMWKNQDREAGGGFLQNGLILARSVYLHHPQVVYSAILTVAVLFAVSRIIFLPRYLVLVVPFMYLAAGSILFELRRPRQITVAFLAVVVLANLANSHGRFFPPIETMLANEFGVEPELIARSGAFLERSWEYERDHQSNIDACEAIERQCQDDVIFAPTPLLHYLCFPRLGYVKKPLHGYAVNDFTRFVDRFQDVTLHAPVDRPPNPVFVWVGNTFTKVSARFQLEPPNDDDEILYDDEQPSPLIVYRRTLADEFPEPQKLEAWYLERMWPTAPILSRAVYRTHYYLATDRIAEAVVEVESLPDKKVHRNQRELLLAGLELRQGDYSTALNRLHTYRQSDDSLDAAYQAMRLDELHETLDPLAIGNDDDVDKLLREAEGYWRRGYTSAANQLLDRALELEADSAGAHFLRGLFALEGVQFADALSAFEATLTANPNHIDAHLCLGWLRLYRGEYELAETGFRWVLEQQPEHRGAKQGLGILLESAENVHSTLDMRVALSDN